ncbi:hypothetical protein ACWF94_16895 [Streptomyces sp. NPDC055078]
MKAVLARWRAKWCPLEALGRKAERYEGPAYALAVYLGMTAIVALGALGEL